MKKTATVLAFALVLVSAAGSAQTPSPRSLIAAIFGAPVTNQACTVPQGGMALATHPGPGQNSTCSATANCQYGPSISCQGSNTCSAVDLICSNPQSGYVTCDGVTQWCQQHCCGVPQGTELQCCKCEIWQDCVSCCRCTYGDLLYCTSYCGS